MVPRGIKTKAIVWMDTAKKMSQPLGDLVYKIFVGGDDAPLPPKKDNREKILLLFASITDAMERYRSDQMYRLHQTPLADQRADARYMRKLANHLADCLSPLHFPTAISTSADRTLRIQGRQNMTAFCRRLQTDLWDLSFLLLMACGGSKGPARTKPDQQPRDLLVKRLLDLSSNNGLDPKHEKAFILAVLNDVNASTKNLSQVIRSARKK